MKFLVKINRNYFIVLSISVTIVSVLGYFTLRYIIFRNTKERLLERVFDVKQQILEKEEICSIYPILEINTESSSTIQNEGFHQIYIQDNLENELEPYIEYATEFTIDGQFYLIKIRQSYIENEDLVSIISIAMLFILLFTFGVNYLVNKKLNKTIWNDFEENLKKIEAFSLSRNTELSFAHSNILEFNRLNTVISELSKKLSKEYKTLKDFTENASHELQTPLSIIALNLEEILQENLSEDILQKVYQTFQSTKKLASLNKNLIFLTKIENNQFLADEENNFHSLIISKLDEYNALIKKLNLEIRIIKNAEFIVLMNKYLAESLVSNLLINAIKHNVLNGFIEITFFSGSINICNSGESSALTNENIFNRFTKSKSSSFGLGLSIVKNICDTNHLSIHYNQKEKTHCILIEKHIENN